MKTLSIKQPWAWAILRAGKDVENRSWSTKFRGRVLIHTGKKIDYEAINLLKSKGLDPPVFSGFNQNINGIVGSVEIIDCVRERDSEWFNGPFGFLLRDPIILPFKPYKGKLGFFEVDYFNL